MSAPAEQPGTADLPTEATGTANPLGEPAHSWLRLSPRIIWVDLVLSALSITPALVAILVFGADASPGQIWPLIGLAAFGVLGALFDIVRWLFTRFRVTGSHVEITTGVLFRQHRSIQRDRIRSVDITAKLRHRLARIRVVTIGAGQQSAAGEAALALDALSVDDARTLQEALLRNESRDQPETDHEADQPGAPTTLGAHAAQAGPAPPSATDPLRVFARFEPTWFIYNMFNIWAFLLALGFGWGGVWLLSSIGVDAVSFVLGLVDWRALGWVGTALIAVVVTGAFGAIGLGVNYFVENWNFELARVPSRDGTALRTRKGLFTTREVNRDENRIRGAQISQPLLWRWMGVTDTSVITTGLDEWSMSEPAAILPRGPLRRAREIAGQVLDDGDNPFRMQLTTHPVRALRRRLVWATGISAGLAAVLTWLAVTDVVAFTAIWAAAAFWPVSLLLAVIAYRALGHRISGRYLITRSGLMNRATTVLQRSAVSTIVISESVLQRRLRLGTVTTATAAGEGGYDTPDLDRADAVAFAVQAAPGLLDPFLVPEPR